MSARPVCLLLLPRKLEGFILRDQAQELLGSPSVQQCPPPRVPYGAVGRLPRVLARAVTSVQARSKLKALRGAGQRPRVVVIFHPLQLPLAEALIKQTDGECELWYGRWDRYEAAYDASPKLRERLATLHERAAERSALTFVASTELARQEHEAGRAAELVTLAADSFPTPTTDKNVVAISLGHLGWRTDWALLRAVAERMDELTLLLIGAWHDDECSDDPDYDWCRRHPAFLWLGARSDEEAARLIALADVGIVPFKEEPFNDAGLPYRILKYARLGRRTVSPELAGVRTWDKAVTTAAGPDEFAAALRKEAGRRMKPHTALRKWALEQSAATVNVPLHKRLRELGLE
jgi:hypothetical protein